MENPTDKDRLLLNHQLCPLFPVRITTLLLRMCNLTTIACGEQSQAFIFNNLAYNGYFYARGALKASTYLPEPGDLFARDRVVLVGSVLLPVVHVNLLHAAEDELKKRKKGGGGVKQKKFYKATACIPQELQY